jgi:hypothetical protein
MRTARFLAVLLVGLAVAAAPAWAQSRFGYGSLNTDGFYRDQSRGYGVDPDQNSRFGYGTGQFGYGNSRYGEGNTRFGEQYSPYGEQLGSYGHQYNTYGGGVPQDWSPASPRYNPLLSGTVPAPQVGGQAAARPAPQTSPTPLAPATQPVLPTPNAQPAPSTQPSWSGP